MFARDCVFSGKQKWWNRAADRQTGTVLQKELPSDTCHRRKKARSYVTDEVVIQTFKSEMDIDIDVKDIDRTHRIGAKTGNKRRPIIVKFARYLERRKVFNSKKRLKGKNLSITQRAWRNYGWVNWEQQEMDMVFEIYGQSMESRYKEMTLPIVKLQFNISNGFATRV